MAQPRTLDLNVKGTWSELAEEPGYSGLVTTLNLGKFTLLAQDAGDHYVYEIFFRGEQIDFDYASSLTHAQEIAEAHLADFVSNS